MNFDVLVDGRAWKIGVEDGSRPGLLRITVKERTREVLASWIDRGTLSLILEEPDSPARSHEVGVRKIDQGNIEITVEGRSVTTSVSSVHEKARRASEPHRTQEASGSRSLAAPMPGRIVRVLAAAGDRVSAGQGIVVIEAMKMENELRSPIDGVVRQIEAKEDEAIDAGAVLAVIEPCR